jgi:nicotinamidase/pyrazinamidase
MTDRMSLGETDILLAVDIQNDYCPGGALGVPRGDKIVPIINKIARRFAHVLVTQDWHPPDHNSFASAHSGSKPYETLDAPYGSQVLWPDHCVQGTRGAEFHPALDLIQVELMLRK